MNQDTDIGERVAELRRRRGMTQEELAEATELSVPTIKKIEQGRGGARMETYHAIARCFGVVTLAFAAPTAPAPCDEYQDPSLAAMRAAINPPIDIFGEPMFDVGVDEPDLRMLSRAIALCRLLTTLTVTMTSPTNTICHPLRTSPCS